VPGRAKGGGGAEPGGRPVTPRPAIYVLCWVCLGLRMQRPCALQKQRPHEGGRFALRGHILVDACPGALADRFTHRASSCVQLNITMQ